MRKPKPIKASQRIRSRCPLAWRAEVIAARPTMHLKIFVIYLEKAG